MVNNQIGSSVTFLVTIVTSRLKKCDGPKKCDGGHKVTNLVSANLVCL